MSTDTISLPIFFAFAGNQLIGRGTLEEVYLAMRDASSEGETDRLALFEERTGGALDIDESGSLEETLTELAGRFPGAIPRLETVEEPAAAKKRGRPKLGVKSREISLLPRHWEWLSVQRGGASSAIRRLVDQAREQEKGTVDSFVVAAAHKFIWDLAGNQPGFEEASRALFAYDWGRLATETQAWPVDIRDRLQHYLDLAVAEK